MSQRLPIVSTLLPPSVRTALMEASRVDEKQAPGSSVARSRALEDVIRRARLFYPHLFKQES
jgi:hypothetical protein